MTSREKRRERFGSGAKRRKKGRVRQAPFLPSRQASSRVRAFARRQCSRCCEALRLYPKISSAVAGPAAVLVVGDFTTCQHPTPYWWEKESTIPSPTWNHDHKTLGSRPGNALSPHGNPKNPLQRPMRRLRRAEPAMDLPQVRHLLLPCLLRHPPGLGRAHLFCAERHHGRPKDRRGAADGVWR